MGGRGFVEQKPEGDVFVSLDGNGENRAAVAASGKCIPKE